MIIIKLNQNIDTNKTNYILQYNPFASRIYDVFSSYKDGKFSFEDFLDFHSIMSHNCPDEVKAKWAFKIFGKRILKILKIIKFYLPLKYIIYYVTFS